MAGYIIRAAVSDETNEGWVWMSGQPSRTVVKITDPKTRRTVFCEVREFDNNFINTYNHAPRISIDTPRQTIVMSEWYRGALGFLEKTGPDNKTDCRELNVQRTGIQAWGTLRAASHHPNLIARLSTRLGILGAWLGIVGFVGALAPLADNAIAKWITIVVALGFGILGMIVCRGPARPPARNSCG
jgi:hypothetical protein